MQTKQSVQGIFVRIFTKRFELVCQKKRVPGTSRPEVYIENGFSTVQVKTYMKNRNG